MIKKILSLFILLSLVLTPKAQAAESDKTIREAKLEKNSVVSISVRDLTNGKEVYSKNESKLQHPASAIKLFTFAAALNTLGENYTFDTTVFADNSGNLYIKLGADPLLTTNDLRTLVQAVKSKYNTKNIKNIYIDATIIDKEPYPSGWLWDDFYPNMSKLSAYTLNQNKTQVALNLSNDKKSTIVIQNNPCKLSIINETTPGSAHKVEVKKVYDEDSEIINLQGTVAQDSVISIPVNNPKYHFIANLNQVLEREKITYKKPYCFGTTPKGAKEVAKVSHTIQEVGHRILKNSDNFSSEILFKVAGKAYQNSTEPGKTQDGLDMFFDYYRNLGLDTNEIRLADASGVSRYNIATAEWMGEALGAILKEVDIKKYMSQPNEGTLNKRLLHLKGRLWAKTGSLNGVSALCGYIASKKGNDYSFAIIISNFNKKPSLIKSFEDDIADDIFRL